MEMHQIRYFLAVERLKNFSRAAEFCNITQPALTRAIQKLEEEVGGRLFLRRPGRVELTELGRKLLPRLEAAQNEVRQAQNEAAFLVNQLKQRLRLGIMCTIGPESLVGLLDRLRAAMPDLELHLIESRGTSIVQALDADEIDVALVGLPRYSDQLEAMPLFTEPYVLALPRDHRLASRPSVLLSELDGENYIERSNCEFDEHFEVTFGEWPIEMEVRFRSGREDWVQAMIAAGLGVSIVPQSLPLLPSLTSIRLIAPEVTRTISLATAKGRALPKPVQILRELAADQSWPNPPPHQGH